MNIRPFPARVRRLSATVISMSLLSLTAIPALAVDSRFAVVGDYGNTTNATNVADHIKVFAPNYVVTVGDNIYSIPAAGSTTAQINAQYDAAIGNSYGSFIKGTASAVQTATSNNFYPSLGNHDIDTDNNVSTGFASNYRNYFDLTPANDPNISASSGSETYYQVTRGAAQLFVLSSDTRDTIAGQSIGSAQRNWLMGPSGNNGVLANSSATWKLVFFHHPAYSTDAAAGSGDHYSNAYMQWGFAGASIVYQGHAHNYERTLVNGLNYIVDGEGGQSIDGGFGAPAYTGPAPAPITMVRDNSNYGFTLVDYSSRFLTTRHVFQNGKILDRLTFLAPGEGPVTARSFKQNINSYTGAHNRLLREDGAATSAADASLKIDADDNAAAGNQRTQGLLRFDNIFGNGATQVPLGSIITSATLTINVTDAGSGIMVHRMTQDWTDTASTWSGSFGGNGVDANNIEALAAADVYLGKNNNANSATANMGVGTFTFDVLKSIQAWSDGQPNYGWLLNYLSVGTDGVTFDAVNSANAPQLDIEFLPAALVPEPASLSLLMLGGLALLRRKSS